MQLLDGFHRLRDLRHIGQACGREYDTLTMTASSFCPERSCPALAIYQAARYTAPAIGRFLAAWVALGTWRCSVRARLRFLLLAASLSRSISIERLHISYFRSSRRSSGSLAQRKRFLGSGARGILALGAFYWIESGRESVVKDNIARGDSVASHR